MTIFFWIFLLTYNLFYGSIVFTTVWTLLTATAVCFFNGKKLNFASGGCAKIYLSLPGSKARIYFPLVLSAYKTTFSYIYFSFFLVRSPHFWDFQTWNNTRCNRSWLEPMQALGSEYLRSCLNIKLVWWWLISYFIWNSSISSNERRKWSKKGNFHKQSLISCTKLRFLSNNSFTDIFCMIKHQRTGPLSRQLIWDLNGEALKPFGFVSVSVFCSSHIRLLNKFGQK